MRRVEMCRRDEEELVRKNWSWRKRKVRKRNMEKGWGGVNVVGTASVNTAPELVGQLGRGRAGWGRKRLNHRLPYVRQHELLAEMMKRVEDMRRSHAVYEEDDDRQL